ncbi:hypothetical protein [Cryptosporangium japonicum]|uniref:hypothetical protein n=1 Tax=Cryptosporangium japonicum TaxID=80872 RepID=UPI0031E229EA
MTVELLLLRATGTGLAYRRVTAPLTGDGHPDNVALELGGRPTLLHSTSWRHTDGGLVLTYVALPDPSPSLPAATLDSAELAVSDDPTRPSPPSVEVRQVAAHACRHLAWLARTDAIARRALDDVPLLRDTLLQFAPAPAGLAGSAR